MVGSEEEYPIFGKVVAIYVLKKMVIFRLNIFHTVTYDPHFHAYVVQLTNNFKFINYDKLISFVPYHLRKSPSKQDLLIVIKQRFLF